MRTQDAPEPASFPSPAARAKPFRVLCVNHRDPSHPKAGGAERYLWETLSRLDPARYEVTWLSEAVRGLPTSERIGPIRVTRRGHAFSLHLLAPFAARGYDLVIESVAHAIPFHTGVTHRGPRIIILYHVHEAVLGRELSPRMAWVARILERTVRWETGTFVAISETTRDEARQKLGVKTPIEVVPPGVDHAYFVPGNHRTSPPDFLYVGRLRRYKRVDAIISAFAALREPGTLTIVGDGDDRERLQQLARNLTGVRFAGSVTEDEKRRLLQEATAMVVASEAEGFGLSILEAGAVATPTIAVDLPIFHEIIQDRVSGVLVPEGDVAALSEGMRWAREHPDLREGARTFAGRFAWETTAARLVRVIEKLLPPNSLAFPPWDGASSPAGGSSLRTSPPSPRP